MVTFEAANGGAGGVALGSDWMSAKLAGQVVAAPRSSVAALRELCEEQFEEAFKPIEPIHQREGIYSGRGPVSGAFRVSKITREHGGPLTHVSPLKHVLQQGLIINRKIGSTYNRAKKSAHSFLIRL
eukprot:3856054-Pyramimonas_sp.AAC.1